MIHSFSVRFTLVVLVGAVAAAHAQQSPDTTRALIDRSLSHFDLPAFEWTGTPEAPKPRLGVYTNAIPADSLRGFPGVPDGVQPVRVWHVMPHWSADEGGMLIGDLIVTLNGKGIGDSVYQYDDYLNIVTREMRPGDPARFVIIRNGRLQTLDIPMRAPDRVAMSSPAPPADLGAIRTNSWLAATIAARGLSQRAVTIQKQMRMICDQDFSTVRFAGRPNPWRLSAVTYLHHNPTRVGAFARQLATRLWVRPGVGGMSATVRLAAADLDLRLPAASDDGPSIAGRTDLDRLLGDVRASLVTAYAPIKGDLDSVSAGLAHMLDTNSWEDRLDTMADPVRKRALRVEIEGRLARLFASADKVDLARIADAAARLALLADSATLVNLAAALEHAAAKPASAVAGAEGTIIASWSSPAGTCVVGGRGANRYTGRFAVIIDLGGNDVYELPPLVPGTARFVGDCGGDDLYRSSTSGQAGGVGGVDILADLGGDDTYRSGYYSQGAGALGVGLLADYAGNDIYQAHWCSQGAAMHGIGVLYDAAGDDRYDADLYSQGFGYVRGFGAILERTGNDSYRAGWKYPDSRYPNRAHLAMSQGFGFGMRPWSTGIGADGGIGVITDLHGDDLYASDFFSQGGSYWYALGVLHDAQGADRYTAGQYSQGSGIHLSFGALLDDGGDDMYDAYAGLEQGNAHDWSAGCLEDAGGNDTYRGSGSSQGSALTVSFSWLLDAWGDDQYYARLSDTTLSQGGGNANRVRGSGSLGMLVDDGKGEDYYVERRIVQGDMLIKENGFISDGGAPEKK